MLNVITGGCTFMEGTRFLYHSLLPRPHPLNGEKGLVNLDKILGPDMDLTTEFCSPNQIAVRVINNIPVRKPLQFFTRTSTSIVIQV